jgi:hypothetical protein
MVEPVEPTTRTSTSSVWWRTPGFLPTPAAPTPAAGFDVEVVRHDAQAGEMGINVVQVLNPRTGEPIYQSPPEGVLVMLESALWRLRKKDTDD